MENYYLVISFDEHLGTFIDF